MEAMTVTNAYPAFTSMPTTTVWSINPAHSKIEFSIDNRLLIVNFTVEGQFPDVSGTITLDERDLTQSRADLMIRTASIETGIGCRDKHLKAADFFDVERYPRMTFASRRIDAVDTAAGLYRVLGDLTLLGVTHPVTLNVRYMPSRSSDGERRISLTGTTTISRRDFGMNHQSPVGGPADEVRVKVAIEATPVS
jgi:polyisoprenoid-binding protein YceI